MQIEAFRKCLKNKCIRKEKTMSFVTNPVQQMTIDDSTFHLTDRERKLLINHGLSRLLKIFSR